MKDAEDEAFDDLAKRQGDWGSGYQAKRAAAMDKINSDFDEQYKKSHAELAKYRAEAQPAQDPVECLDCGSNNVGIPATYDSLVNSVKSQPVQEPPSEWAGIKAILDEYGLQAIDFVADFKAALAQPAQEPDLTAVYMSGLYDGKKKKHPWVGLTDEEISELIRATYNTGSFVRAIEAKLKEKNT